MVADNSSLAAHYEYGPFGGLLASSGTHANDNPWRFSSKYFDAESALSYYGYRYYDPEVGRWISMDPLGEWGGINVYMFVYNAPVRYIDIVGLETAVVPLPDGCCKRKNIDAEGDTRARQAYKRSMKDGIGERQEYCGLICCKKDGVVVSTPPHTGYGAVISQGRWHMGYCNPHQIGRHGAAVECPKDSQEVGTYHSHPSGSATPAPRWMPGEGDWGSLGKPECKKCGHCGYIGGSEGKVCRYWIDDDGQDRTLPVPPPDDENGGG